jgi:hypothetical protein
MAHEVGYPALNPFFEPSFDWLRIRRAARHFSVLVAADDPVLVPDPFEHIGLFVTNLGATATVTAAGGHFPSWSPDTPPRLPELPKAVRLVTDILSERS